MILIASSLALLVIYAGVKLLIQTKKEMLGHLYRCAAWFFIVGGFLTLACAGACCIAMCCKYGSGMMHKEYKMTGEEDGHYMNGYHHGCKKMMKHYAGGHEEGCVININCCEEEMEKHCDYNEFCKADSMKRRK
ncbi:MAG TPA: hypothetical protein VNZ49_15145 [Bacteroidia bacterium]|jgi:hypothetical protein|nr:hypothetical protein [Bacteroidia bacterium]